MLFNITKQASLAILQFVAALFILIAPSAIGEIPAATGIYMLLIVFSILLCVRIKNTQRVDISVSHLAYLILAGYAIITSFWAGNREGNLLYFFSILVLMLFHALARDYFAENMTDNIKRRSLYLLSISGIICSIVNFFYWIGKVVPVAGKTSLYKGLGTNDFLGIFLYFSILTSVTLTKGNSKIRKVLLILAAVMMAFIFILAKSMIAWAFAIIFTLAYFCKEKRGKIFSFSSLAAAIIFTVFAIISVSRSEVSSVSQDVLAFSIKNLYGLGGGFWSARETFLASSYQSIPQVGLFAYLFASSGIIGLIVCVFIFFKSIILFTRLKNMTGLAALLLCVAVFILPFGENIAVILLLIGLNTYNEQLAGMDIQIRLEKDILRKTTYVACILAVVSAMLFLHSIIKISAKNAYDEKDYATSYSLYKIAGSINICDSESLKMATVSLRKTGEIVPLHDTAIRIIDKAIKRDRNNLSIINEKALIYDACGEFELSAQQYRDAVQKAFNKDKYNLLLAKELYKIVEKSPKGSPETKRSYEEIIQIAQSTQNLNRKKEINDIADQAFKYTKGDFASEG